MGTKFVNGYDYNAYIDQLTKERDASERYITELIKQNAAFAVENERLEAEFNNYKNDGSPGTLWSDSRDESAILETLSLDTFFEAIVNLWEDVRHLKEKLRDSQAVIKAAQEQEPVAHIFRVHSDRFDVCQMDHLRESLGAFAVYRDPVPAQSPVPDAINLLQRVAASSAHDRCPSHEPVVESNPHEWIIEKLSYHKFERDDLTIDEALSYLASEWKEVRGREVRPLVMQILALLASAPAISNGVQDSGVVDHE